MTQLDLTHDPQARSWVESANDPATDFPIQNLPLCVFRVYGGQPKIGVAIGDQVLDVEAAVDAGGILIPPLGAIERGTRRAIRGQNLNALMALGRPGSRVLRHALFEGLSAEAPRRARNAIIGTLYPMGIVELLLPVEIGDYTDFYASIHHATNVGSMFRPDNPLLPNYKWVPIGYHGRASSVVVSGTRTSTCSARCCSSTGRRATCRRGSTSRWVLSWRRISSPACPRGS